MGFLPLGFVRNFHCKVGISVVLTKRLHREYEIYGTK